MKIIYSFLLLLIVGCSSEQKHISATFNMFSLNAPQIKKVLYYLNQSSPADVDALGIFELKKNSSIKIKELCKQKGRDIPYTSSGFASVIAIPHSIKIRPTKGCELTFSNKRSSIFIYIDNSKNIMFYKFSG